MKRLLNRLVIIAILVGGGYLLWGERHRIASIQNNSLRIQGDWYKYEMNRKGFEAYHFSERFITADGVEWGSYRIRSNEEIEVTVGSQLTHYHLSIPDEDNMVWSLEVKGELKPVQRWRR